MEAFESIIRFLIRLNTVPRENEFIFRRRLIPPDTITVPLSSLWSFWTAARYCQVIYKLFLYHYSTQTMTHQCTRQKSSLEDDNLDFLWLLIVNTISSRQYRHSYSTTSIIGTSVGFISDVFTYGTLVGIMQFFNQLRCSDFLVCNHMNWSWFGLHTRGCSVCCSWTSIVLQ